MRKFGEWFKHSIERQIDEETERTKESNYNNFIQEIIHHANRANKLTKKMSSHSDYYESVENYLRDDNNTCPFIIIGSSGTGKSSLMAFVAKKVKIFFKFKLSLKNITEEYFI